MASYRNLIKPEPVISLYHRVNQERLNGVGRGSGAPGDFVNSIKTGKAKLCLPSCCAQNPRPSTSGIWQTSVPDSFLPDTTPNPLLPRHCFAVALSRDNTRGQRERERRGRRREGGRFTFTVWCSH